MIDFGGVTADDRYDRTWSYRHSYQLGESHENRHNFPVLIPNLASFVSLGSKEDKVPDGGVLTTLEPLEQWVEEDP